MATRPQAFNPHKTARLIGVALDDHRGKTADRGYGAAWQRAAKAHLRAHPLCVYCELGAWGQPRRVTAATLVDHYHPHRGDRGLFWVEEAWASSCTPCHSGPKQRLERQGPVALDRVARRLGFPSRAEAMALAG